MKAYTLHPDAPTPAFASSGVVMAKCFDVLKRAKAPQTVAQVREKVEAHFGEECAVRHALMRLAKAGLLVAHDL